MYRDYHYPVDSCRFTFYYTAEPGFIRVGNVIDLIRGSSSYIILSNNNNMKLELL